jgi:hypothetical protein
MLVNAFRVFKKADVHQLAQLVRADGLGVEAVFDVPAIFGTGGDTGNRRSGKTDFGERGKDHWHMRAARFFTFTDDIWDSAFAA